jgi:hypothetical protein
MELTGPDRGPHTVRGWLPWAAVGAVLLVLAGVAVVTLFVAGPGDAAGADSVEDVADLAVDAADDLDVAAGIDLLCELPMDLYRMSLETLIDEGRDEAGTDDPDVDYEVSDVSDGPTGSFVVTISSDEEGLADRGTSLRVFVEQRDGRSCIVGVGEPDAEEPEVEVAPEGYGRVTSPSVSPRGSDGTTP